MGVPVYRAWHCAGIAFTKSPSKNEALAQCWADVREINNENICVFLQVIILAQNGENEHPFHDK